MRSDLKPRRPQTQRHDGRLGISLAAGVGKATQASKYRNVAAGHHFGPRIDVSQHHHVTLMPDNLTGAARGFHQQGRVPLALEIAGPRRVAQFLVHQQGLLGFYDVRRLVLHTNRLRRRGVILSMGLGGRDNMSSLFDRHASLPSRLV